MLLVAIGLLALLLVAVSLLRELSRTARSAERLCEILARDLPPTLEAIRLTGLEITELTDDVNEGVHHAGQVIRQLDQGLLSARQQAQQVQVGGRSLWAGVRAAWHTWQAPPRRKRPRRLHSRHGEVNTRRKQPHQPGTQPQPPKQASIPKNNPDTSASSPSISSSEVLAQSPSADLPRSPRSPLPQGPSDRVD